MAFERGTWHGETYYFGLHYDLHAGEKDTELGTRCSLDELVPMLQLMAPDFVQTDCKGHPGWTSWFSKVKTASVVPGLKQDALRQWRDATAKLGMPLHCHYSGIWDKAAGAKYPDWAVKGPGGEVTGAPFGQNAGAPTPERMCPRSPYLDKLMIPQLRELIDRYHVDGFWVDGDLWAAEPCYCAKCRAAFTAETGIAEPPVEPTDANWPAWWNFTRESFEAYVTRYCDAVHQHKPGVLVCSNWLQTFRHPGEPTVPTDWISGDNSWVWGLDGSRCEARFLATRGKPWDIMLWAFYCSHGMGKPDSPWTFKPPQMLMQEAAVLLSFGGNVQIYENTNGVRDGRLVPWRQRRLRGVGRFIRQRRTLCQDSESLPQIAVLHSEHHARSKPSGKNLMWNIDTAPVQGALYALLECHYGVDVLDEWALLPCLDDYPIVVAPEQDAMSDKMVKALKSYVRRGGRLLLTGAAAFDRFGGDWLGAESAEVKEKVRYHVPVDDGCVPLHSDRWRLLTPTKATPIGQLGTSPLLDDRLLPHPAAIAHRVGKGKLVYMPANVCRDFAHNRYPMTRLFLGELVDRLTTRLGIRVTAPVCVDVALRRKGKWRLVHLVNRGSGIANTPNNGAIDEIPPVGPVTIRLRQPKPPKSVRLAFEDGEVTIKHESGSTVIFVPLVHIHAAVVIE